MIILTEEESGPSRRTRQQRRRSIPFDLIESDPILQSSNIDDDAPLGDLNEEDFDEIRKTADSLKIFDKANTFVSDARAEPTLLFISLTLVMIPNVRIRIMH